MSVFFRDGTFKYFDFDDEDSDEEEEDLELCDLFELWQAPIDFFDGTLGDLLTYARNADKDEVNNLECLTDSNILAFLDEKLLGEPNEEPLDSLLVLRVVELELLDGDGEPHMHACVVMAGLVDGDEHCVDYRPLVHLVALPLNICPAAEIRDFRTDEAERFSTTILLGEFLSAVFFAVCGFGSPQERNDAKKDLDQAIEEAERRKLLVKPGVC